MVPEPAAKGGGDLQSDQQLLDLAAVEHVTHAKRSTLARWIATDRFPRPVHLGRRVFWRAEDVQNWLNAQLQNS
ncbi:MAG: AlpA family phage regulatory protein [Cyanobacteria bacterium REEB65]|nr:AlpA family phage regulatory protein [Cyanobacteria bacterium REEB65]